jgi:hypothetical protein
MHYKDPRIGEKETENIIEEIMVQIFPNIMITYITGNPNELQ